MTTAPVNYISTKEAAARAEVSPKTVLRWMRLGLFGGKRKDRRESLVNEGEFEQYLASFTSIIHGSSRNPNR